MFRNVAGDQISYVKCIFRGYLCTYGVYMQLNRRPIILAKGQTDKTSNSQIPKQQKLYVCNAVASIKKTIVNNTNSYLELLPAH